VASHVFGPSTTQVDPDLPDRESRQTTNWHHTEHPSSSFQMSYFKTKKHQIRYRLGLCFRPHSAPPGPLVDGEGGWLLPPQESEPRSRPCGPRFSRLRCSAFRFFFIYNSNPVELSSVCNQPPRSTQPDHSSLGRRMSTSSGCEGNRRSGVALAMRRKQ